MARGQRREGGPEVVDFLAWLELGGAATATLDQYERDLSRGCLMYPDRDVTTLTDTEFLQVVRSFCPSHAAFARRRTTRSIDGPSGHDA
jgi:hypothetical protein